jgi:hypothetical protein
MLRHQLTALTGTAVPAPTHRHLPGAATCPTSPPPAAGAGGRRPLFWSHADLYGTIQIDMETHLVRGRA